MVTKPAANHQRSDKSLKIKYQPLKELENGTPYKDVASLFGVTRTLSPFGEKTKKKLTNHMKVIFGLKE